MSKKEIAEAYFVNVKQLIEQYKAKRKQSDNLRWLKTFKPLTNDILKNRLNEIQELIDSESYDSAVS